jgi:PAS domain S-box-containing protein
MIRAALQRSFIAIVILAAFLFTLSPCLADTVTPRTLRVVMDNNYPPYVFLDKAGNLQGILIDQWRLWEKKNGIKIELSGLDWSEAQQRMEAGEFDVIDTIFRNERREKIYDFTKPHAVIPVPLYFHRDLSGIRSAADLTGFVVAAKAGGNVLNVLRKNGVTSIAEFPSYESIIEAARDGKVKVFTVDRPPAIYYLNKFGIQNQFRETAPMYSGEFHRAVRKGNHSLLTTVESGFAKITPEEYQAIDKLWLGTPLLTNPSIRYVAYFAAACLLVVLILIMSLRILKNAVARKTGELAASENRYRTLIDNLPLGISLIDREHRIVMVNRSLTEHFGMQPEQFVGQLCYQVYEKREQICAHCPGSVSITTGKVAQVDTEGVREDGSRFPVHIHTVPLPGSNGLAEAFIEVVENTTERRKAEQTLENERTRLRTLLQTIPDLVWLKDTDGVYLACNPRFEQFFGALAAEIIGKTDYDFVDRELADFFRQQDLKAIAAGQPSVNEEWVTYASDGHHELLETIKTPMRETDGTLIGVLGIARNITEKRELENERLQLEMERERSQRLESLGVLAGGIAHDFNNILTGILGNVTIARKMVNEDDKVTQRLNECEKATRRAAELTQQLLTFAKGGEPVLTSVATRQLIEESLAFALRGANVKGLLDSPPDIWWLHADAGQISQVFNNLFINAKQAMPDGGTITVTVTNVTFHEGDQPQLAPGNYVRIALSDQGSGISAENLPKIFDPYFTTKKQGSGLGLASVYSIIKRHEGAISVSSPPGKGTVFTLLLPAISAAITEQPKPVALSQQSCRGRILLMDDEELIRDLAMAMLDELGYEGETCADGSDAVARHAIARQAGTPYAAIILDLTVPGGMGGKEAALRIRALDANTPLIVSSGYSSDAVLAECHEYGFSGVINKPYSLDELTAELQRLIRH